jgi:WD40 repeat protein/beta-lactamase regulating signal transducer with metallopeptidase domain
MTNSIFDTACRILLDSTVKGTVLVVMAIGAVALLKGASAAARHRVYSLSLIALLCLPLLNWLLPAWQLRILPRPEGVKNIFAAESAPISQSLDHRMLADTDEGERPLVDKFAPLQKRSPQSLGPSSHAALRKNLPQPSPGSIPAIDSSIRLPDVSPPIAPSYLLRALLWAWSIGVVIGLIGLAAGVWKTNQILVTTVTVEDESWRALFDQLCRSLGLHQRIELRFNGSPIVPMTWGVWKPTVSLPQSASAWPPETRRAVLLHELIHIQRGDITSQLLGRLACIMYWHNPLAWYCLHQMRIEREKACDDAVVHFGERASDYAGQLLRVARLCPCGSAFSLAVEMTRHIGLEQRLQSLFDSVRSHQPLGRGTAWIMSMASLFFVCGIAIVKPVERSLLVSADDQRTRIAEDARKSVANKRPLDSKHELNWLPGLISSPQPLPGNRRWQMYAMNHRDSADSVGWSPDGRWLAMSIGPVVRLFDSQKGLPSFKRVFAGHLDTVFEVHFNHRGDQLATASNDGTVRIWDLDGREQFVYRGHGDAVLSVSWHPDDTRLASSSSDGTARIWATDGTTVALLKGHEAEVTAVAWNPNGKLLATGGEDKTIRYWSEDGTSDVVINDAHIGPVRSIEWNRDGSRLLTCDFGIESATEEEQDRSHMKLWDTDGKLVSSIMINRPLSHVSWNPEGTIAIAGSWKAVWSWKIGDREANQHHVGGWGIVPVAWRPTGDLVAAGPDITNADGKILGMQTFPGAITSLGLNPAGTILVAGREDRTFVLFDTDGQQVREILPNPNPYGLTSKQCITWNPDGSILLPGFTSSNSLQKFDSAGQRIGDSIPVPGGTCNIAWSNDGRWIAGTGGSRTVWLLDVATSKSTVLGRHEHGATGVRFTPDQKYVCSTGWDGCIRFWTLNGIQEKVFETVAAPIDCVAVSNDGQLVASGHQDRRIRIWNSDGEILKVVGGHGGYVEIVEFNPEGTLLASGSRDHTVRIWKRDGSPVAVFRGHSGSVFGIQWTPDGRGIYSCAEDGTIRRWNVETGATEWLAIRGKNDRFVTLDAQGRVKYGDETILETDMIFFQEDNQRRIVPTRWAEIKNAFQLTTSQPSK